MDELEMIRRRKMLELMKRAGIIETKPKRKVVIKVITSPGCPYCPIAVAMAKELERKYEGIVAKELSVATPEGRRKAMEHNILGTPCELFFFLWVVVSECGFEGCMKIYKIWCGFF